MFCVLCEYLDINHQNYRKLYQKCISLEITNKDPKSQTLNETLLKKYFLQISNLLVIVNNIEINYLELQPLFEVLKSEENYVNLLDISYNNMTLSTINSLGNYLKSNSSVESLYLRGDDITDQEANMLCEVIKVNKSIKILELSNNKLTNLSCKVFSELLKQNKTLKDLFISRNLFSNEGVKYLTDGLIVNRYLKCLDISHNNLTSESSVYLCVLFKNTKSLEKIILIGNNFGNDGLKNIFEGLVFNSSLKVIFLDNNKIADLFGFQIKEILQNPSLQCISLSNNNFSDITAEYISHALVQNNMLISLNLNNNRITDFGVNLLLTSIKNKENFKNLVLSNNKYSAEVGKKLLKFSDKFNFENTSFLSKEFYYLSEKYIDFDNFQEK